MAELGLGPPGVQNWVHPIPLEGLGPKNPPFHSLHLGRQWGFPFRESGEVAC